MINNITNIRINVEIKKCLACETCSMYCVLEHSKSKNLYELINEKDKPLSGIFIKQKEDKIAAVFCRHCKNALCIDACDREALYRISDEEPVSLNTDMCTGCGECVKVCPFEAIRLNTNNKSVTKCDLCGDRLNNGRNPACVDSCPTEAIKLIVLKRGKQ